MKVSSVSYAHQASNLLKIVTEAFGNIYLDAHVDRPDGVLSHLIAYHHQQLLAYQFFKETHNDMALHLLSIAGQV